MRRSRLLDAVRARATSAVTVFVALVLVALVSVPARADTKTMRCGGHRVYAGGGPDATRMYEVLKKCGEPQERAGYRWLYTQGGMRRYLTFGGDGRLWTIESERM